MRTTYRGYTLEITEDGRTSLSRGLKYEGDYPSQASAVRAIDYRLDG